MNPPQPHTQPTQDIPADSWAKITIITPSFNQGRYLGETIESIRRQAYPNLEFIVIDGGSSDQSVEIIRQNVSFITHWVSEKDRGQSHAINKGVALATGDIIQWINSDDLLTEDALFTVACLFMQHPDTNMVAGKCLKFGDGMDEKLVPRFVEHPHFEDLLLNMWFMQPGCFFRASAFKQLMPLNESLHFCMDTDLFVRYFLQFGDGAYLKTDTALVRFRMHDQSKTVQNQLRFNEERLLIDLNILATCGLSCPYPINGLLPEEALPHAYPLNQKIDATSLMNTFLKKWQYWFTDPSAKYRTVAEYAGWHKDYKAMRKYSRMAFFTNPWKSINLRYWLKSFLLR